MMTCQHPPARIVTSKGRQWWRCPSCNRTMGEVKDDVVLIQAGDRLIVVSIGDGVTQRCRAPECGVWSVVRGEG